MSVDMYGKKGCAKCDSAEDKLKRLGVKYTKHDLEAERDNPPRDKDQRAKLVQAGVAWAWGKETLPVFVVDGVGMSYPEAMKRLKAKPPV